MTPDMFRSIVNEAALQADALALAREKLDKAVRRMEDSARALFELLWQQSMSGVHPRYFLDLRKGFGTGNWDPTIKIHQVNGLHWTTQGWYAGFVDDSDYARASFAPEDAVENPDLKAAVDVFCAQASQAMGVRVRLRKVAATPWPDYFHVLDIQSLFPQRKIELLEHGKICMERDEREDPFAFFTMDGDLMLAITNDADYCTYVFRSDDPERWGEAMEWLADDLDGRHAALIEKYARKE